MLNSLDIITGFYGKLHSNNLASNRMLSPIRCIVRSFANWYFPRYLSRSKKVNQQLIKERIIVSLTSFPARIDNVWQVVECMLRQTVKPHKIILWLSNVQFANKKELPNSLLARENGSFEIRLVNGDIRSHKKYLYASREYNKDLIFLVDDDIYYSSTIIEHSLKRYRSNPHSIICNYGCQIVYDESGKHLPYLNWCAVNSEDNVFFGSGGGTLFCPMDMYHDLTNEKLALSLTPTADDVWLNAMARIKGTKVIFTTDKLLLPIQNRNSVNLSTINNDQSQNDVQINNIENHYGRCFDLR